MKKFIIHETQTFGKNHSKFQKHFFGINQFLRFNLRNFSDKNKIYMQCNKNQQRLQRSESNLFSIKIHDTARRA